MPSMYTPPVRPIKTVLQPVPVVLVDSLREGVFMRVRDFLSLRSRRSVRRVTSARALAVLGGCFALVLASVWPIAGREVTAAAIQAPTGGQPIRVLFLGQDETQPH